MNSSSASKVTERHLVLVANIGTFAEEDEAYQLLNRLSISLPIVAMVTWVLDALLGVVYLKWFHPWRILLQEVSSFRFQFRLLTLISQEPDQWEPETDDESGIGQDEEVGLIATKNQVLTYLAADGGRPDKRCHCSCPC